MKEAQYTIIGMLIGLIIIQIFLYESLRTQISHIKIPAPVSVSIPKPKATTLTCTGTLNENLSGQTSQESSEPAAKTSDQALADLYQGSNVNLSGTVPVTLNCK